MGPAEAKANAAKHRVSFEEATTVFGDPGSLTIGDEAHSGNREDRFVTRGLSARGRILVVIHCDRGDIIRVISARRATAHERRQYEQED